MSTQEISAVVIPMLEGGRRISPRDIITASNVAQYRVDPAAGARAKRFFRDAGFSVAPLIGISFSITGPLDLFESVFGGRLTAEESVNVIRSVTTADGKLELPLDELPDELAAAIQAVAFCPVELYDDSTSFEI